MKRHRRRPDIKAQTNTKVQEVFNVNHFHGLFEKEKRRYPPSFFNTDKKPRRKRKEGVSLKLFKKIILEYFKMYFFEFYMSQKAIYFPLGGFMKKVLYDKWTAFMPKGKTEKRLVQSDGAIGLFWYRRPSRKMQYMVYLRKQQGSTNRITKMERVYKENFNKDLLPIFDSELKKHYHNNTLYLCSLT